MAQDNGFESFNMSRIEFRGFTTTMGTGGKIASLSPLLEQRANKVFTDLEALSDLTNRKFSFLMSFDNASA